jgi:hypothetical protein
VRSPGGTRPGIMPLIKAAARRRVRPPRPAARPTTRTARPTPFRRPPPAPGRRGPLFHVKQPRGRRIAGVVRNQRGSDRLASEPRWQASPTAGFSAHARSLWLDGWGDRVGHRCCAGEVVAAEAAVPSVPPPPSQHRHGHPSRCHQSAPTMVIRPWPRPTILVQSRDAQSGRPLRQLRQGRRPGPNSGRGRARCPPPADVVRRGSQQGAVAKTDRRGRRSPPGARTSARHRPPRRRRRVAGDVAPGVNASPSGAELPGPHRMVAAWLDDADPSAPGIECRRRRRRRRRTRARCRLSAVVGTIAGLAASEARPRLGDTHSSCRCPVPEAAERTAPEAPLPHSNVRGDPPNSPPAYGAPAASPHPA